jgi:hypothetical protein
LNHPFNQNVPIPQASAPKIRSPVARRSLDCFVSVETTPLVAAAPAGDAAEKAAAAAGDAGVGATPVATSTRLDAHLPPHPPTSASTSAGAASGGAAPAASTPTFVSAITTRNGMFLPSPPEEEEDDKENTGGATGGRHSNNAQEGADDEKITVTVKRPSVHWGQPTTFQVTFIPPPPRTHFKPY